MAEVGAPVEIGVLGPVEIRGPAGARRLGSARQRALLVALVLGRPRLVRLDELCDVLWGQDLPPTAVVSLRSHLTRLRAALAGAGAPGDVLQWRDSGYVLGPEVGCDADRFEEAVAAAGAAAAAGQPRRAVELLPAALALWRGPALAEFAGQPFARDAAARLEDLRLGATEDLCAALLITDRASEALATLDGHTAVHPLRERGAELRMRALYRLGRQAEALEQYRRMRAFLSDELGIEPNAALRALERQILRQDPELDAPAAPEPGPPEVSRPPVSGPSPAPPRGAGHTPFVGRVGERAVLDRLLDGAAGGAGGLVLIGGEPGVGKTRLAEEVLDAAASRGLVTYAGHCYDAAGAPPFVALVEIMESALARAESPGAWRAFLAQEAPEVCRLVPKLRRMCPDIPAPLDLPPEQERRLLFNSLRDVLARRARRCPVVLLFDDLQWADEPTLLFLEHLADGLAGLPVLLLATYRNTEVDLGGATARTFENLRRRRLAHWLDLERLGEADVAGILTGLSGQPSPAGLTSAVHAASEGNPFFVEEVYRNLVEEDGLFDAEGRFRADLTTDGLNVPAGVRLVLGRRLARLAPGTVPVLAVAAVAGRAFSVELLGAVEGFDPDGVLDAVEDAARARVVVAAPDPSGEDRFIFAHELIRQTLLADLSLTRRRRSHARVADARERRYAGSLDGQAATIAHHVLEAGGDDLRAFAWLARAGRFALAGAAFEEAARHFERAVAVAAAYNLVFLARFGDGIAIAQRGLDVLGDRPSPARGRLLGLIAFPLAYVGQRERAGAMVAQELALARALGDDALRADALANTVTVLLAHMEHREILARGAEACALLRAGGDAWNLVKVAGFMGYAAVGMGSFDLARSLVAEFLPVAERLGHHNPVTQFTRSLGVVEFATAGDVDRIARLGREDRAMQESLGLPWPSGWSWLGLAEFLRGRWEEALPLYREAARREPPGALQGWNAALLLEGLAYGGHRAEALELLEAHALPDPAQPETGTWGAAQLLVFAAEALVVLGERDRAAALYPALLEVYERTGALCPSYDDARLWARSAGIAAAACGQWDLAEGHFRTALEQALALPHRFEQAHTRRWHGLTLLSRGAPGDRSAAAVLLAAAADDYARMGVPRHRDLCQAALAGR